jgi:hypothetical protein
LAGIGGLREPVVGLRSALRLLAGQSAVTINTIPRVREAW